MLRIALLLLTISHFSFAQQTSEVQKVKLDSLFQIWSGGPGVAVGIVMDGEVVYQHFSGWADKEHNKAITSETTFWIASVSKQFTAMAVTALESQGKLNLDEKISDFLPELSQFPEVKVKHLLHHTSGLRDGYTLVGMTLKGKKHYDPASVLGMLSMQKELNFRPGSRFEYINSNYVLLALIVERVTKKPFAEFMKSDVFLPLGMTHARVYHDDKKASDAIGYMKKNNHYKGTRHYLQAIGSSGVMLSMNDAVKLEKQFHKKDSDMRVTKMVETEMLNDGSTAHYTRGLEKYKVDSTIVFSHFGSDPGFRADILRIPAARLSVIIFSNASDYWSLTRNLFDAAGFVLGKKFGVDKPATSTFNIPLKMFAGTYLDTISGSAIRFVKQGDERLKASGSLNGYYADLIRSSEKTFLKDDFYETAYTFDHNKLIVDRVDGREVFVKTDSSSFTKNTRQVKGKYYSGELKKRYRITYKRGMLRLSFLRIIHSRLYPVGKNSYYSEFAGGNILSFEKDGDKDVMMFSRDGIKRLKFVKIK